MKLNINLSWFPDSYRMLQQVIANRQNSASNPCCEDFYGAFNLYSKHIFLNLNQGDAAISRYSSSTFGPQILNFRTEFTGRTILPAEFLTTEDGAGSPGPSQGTGSSYEWKNTIVHHISSTTWLVTKKYQAWLRKPQKSWLNWLPWLNDRFKVSMIEVKQQLILL